MGQPPHFSGWHPYFSYWNQHLWWFFFQHFLKQEAWKAQQWLTWCPPSQAEAQQSERWDDGIQWSHQTKIGFRGRWIPQVFVNPCMVFWFSTLNYIVSHFFLQFHIWCTIPNTVFHHFSIWQIPFWDQADKTISGKFTSVLFFKKYGQSRSEIVLCLIILEHVWGFKGSWTRWDSGLGGSKSHRKKQTQYISKITECTWCFHAGLRFPEKWVCLKIVYP